jgi:hypothetical protein
MENQSKTVIYVRRCEERGNIITMECPRKLRIKKAKKGSLNLAIMGLSMVLKMQPHRRSEKTSICEGL